MQNQENSEGYRPAYVLAAEALHAGGGRAAEDDLARAARTAPRHFRLIMDALVCAQMASYPDGRVPAVGFAHAGDTPEQFAAAAVEKLPRTRLWHTIEQFEGARHRDHCRRAGARRRKEFLKECAEWDRGLPPGLVWGDGDIAAVHGLWLRNGGAVGGEQALGLARDLGQKYSSVCFYLGQFDFCDGRGSIWNVQDRAALIFADGDEDVYLDILERVAKARGEKADTLASVIGDKHSESDRK